MSLWFSLWPACAATAVTERSIGIEVSSLQVIDRRAARNRAKTVLRSWDPAITITGAGTPETLAARVSVEYASSSAFGAFLIPRGVGAGWQTVAAPDGRYSNLSAPQGPTQVKGLALKSGRSFKMVALGVGDVPLELGVAGPPDGSVYVTVELNDADTTTRLCAEMTLCEHFLSDDGRVRLTCRDGLPDPTCRGARPVYRASGEVLYGGPRTVAILGDSITVQAGDALRAHLSDSSWYAYVGATAGIMFREIEPLAKRIALSRPNVVVLNLGTNDAACYFQNVYGHCRFPDYDLMDMLTDARTMVNTFAADACVLGTTVWFGEENHPISPLWHEMAAAGELAGVVEWSEYLGSLSDDERNTLLLDGLGHLTAAGRDALARLTTETVDTFCSP